MLSLAELRIARSPKSSLDLLRALARQRRECPLHAGNARVNAIDYAASCALVHDVVCGCAEGAEDEDGERVEFAWWEGD
jgi:hypothetical protein